jgi:2'-5' RNA ligase
MSEYERTTGYPGVYAGTMKIVAGQTALVVKVPEAEPVVSRWRERFDPSAVHGVPAHVTVLYPFLDHSRIDDRILGELRELFAGHASFEVRFSRCGRFPGVLYLAPKPDGPFTTLTESVVERWPEAPPYRGRFAEVIPHLTVADGADASTHDSIEADVVERLPVLTHAHAVTLLVREDVMWREAATFPLGG